MYNNEHIKTKTKIYINRVYANSQYNEIPKDNEYYTCLSVMLLDSVVKIGNNNYPQVFLEERKYALKI